MAEHAPDSNIQLARHQKARATAGTHASKGASASKYDFVKVKVWLQAEETSHYYVLSRFLISRALTVTHTPHTKAVKIALELKKYCVDNGLLNISQAQLKEVLFGVMRDRGYGDLYVARYKMVSRLHLQRRPLIIFLCGSACTGKSTLAQQLAARLNMPNVLQTDVIYELLRSSGKTSLHPDPLWLRPELTQEQLLSAYLEECAVVRRGINADLDKVLKDGKSFIMEGLHLEPGMYLYEFGGLCQTGGTIAVNTDVSCNPLQDGHASYSPEAGPCSHSDSDAAMARFPVKTVGGAPQPSGSDIASAPSESVHDYTADITRVMSPSQTVCQHQDLCTDKFASADTSTTNSCGDLTPGQTDSQSRQSAVQPTESTSRRQRIKHRLRNKLPGWPSHEMPTGRGHPPSAAASAPAPLKAALPSTLPPASARRHQHSRAALSKAASPAAEAEPSESRGPPPAPKRSERRALFALRRTDSSMGELHPRLAPWPIAKRVLEALNPLRSAPSTVPSRVAHDHMTQHPKSVVVSEAEASGIGSETVLSATSADSSSALVRSEGRPTLSTPMCHISSTMQRQHPQGVYQRQEPSNGMLSDEGGGCVGRPSLCDTATSPTLDQDDDALSSVMGTGYSGEADAAINSAGDSSGDNHLRQPAPVFVPIVLDMDLSEQEEPLQGWLARQQSVSGEARAKEDVLRAVSTLQHHLCTYQGRMVPVVRISTTAFSRTLDDVHDYLLQCMQLAVDAG